MADDIIQKIEIQGTIDGIDEINRGLNDVREATEELIETVNNTAKELNIEIETGDAEKNLRRLESTFEQVGLGSGQLAKAMFVTEDALKNASFTADTGRGIFRQLGVALEDLEGNARPATDVLVDFLDKLAGIEDPARRAEAAVDAFGTGIGRALASGITEVSAATETLDNTLSGTSLRLVQFGNTLDELFRSLQGIAAGFVAAGVGIVRFANLIKGAIIPVTKFIATVGAAPLAMFGLARSASNSTKELENMAAAAGTTTNEFERMMNVFGQVGGATQGQVMMALSLISQQTARAKEAGELTSGAFEKLNIRLMETATVARSPAAVLADLADKIKDIEDPADRAATVAQVFGRRVGAQLTSALALGSAGMAAMADEIERIAPATTEAQIAIGKDFSSAMFLAGAAVRSLRTQLGLAFAPAFSDAARAFAAAVAAVRPQLVSLAETIADIVGPLLTDLLHMLTGNVEEIQAGWLYLVALAVKGLAIAISSAFTGVIFPIMEGWMIILNRVADIWNKVFGTDITGSDILITAILIKWFGLFSTFSAVLGVATKGMLLFNAAFVASPIGRIIALGVAIGALIAWLVDNYWDDFVKGWQFASSAWTKMWDFAINSVMEFWTNLKDWAAKKNEEIIQDIKDALGWVGRLISALARAIGLAGSLPGAGGGGGVERARGGAVYGPGTSTSDSIPAWLSSGEFVIKAAAVRKYGLGLFNALNNMRLGDMDRLRYNMGGFVDDHLSMPLRMAEGGHVPTISGGRPLSLTIDGETFEGLSTPEDVADRLIKFASRKKTVSIGNKPPWMGK